MPRGSLSFIALFVLSTVPGCIPLPVERTYIPRTVGTLTTEGEPAVGALVYRTGAGPDEPEPCQASPDTSAFTSASGAFDLPAVTRRTVEAFWLIGFNEAPFQTWTTCFVAGADTLASQEFLWPPRSSALFACETSEFTEERGCEIKRLCPNLNESECEVDSP